MPSLSKLVLAPVGLAALARAWPSYVALNPNGANAGVDAIGHINPGGGGVRNQYGTDWDQIGKAVWTVQLCQMDSDGDGQTNGFELGDPCCTWVVGGPPPLFQTGISQVRSSCDDGVHT
jgi:hypothetical protein